MAERRQRVNDVANRAEFYDQDPQSTLNVNLFGCFYRSRDQKTLEI
jgi:hypothetical protein